MRAHVMFATAVAVIAGFAYFSVPLLRDGLDPADAFPPTIEQLRLCDATRAADLFTRHPLGAPATSPACGEPLPFIPATYTEPSSLTVSHHGGLNASCTPVSLFHSSPGPLHPLKRSEAAAASYPLLPVLGLTRRPGNSREKLGPWFSQLPETPHPMPELAWRALHLLIGDSLMELSDELVLLCYSLIGCGFNCFVDADTIVFVINPPMVPSAAVQVFCEVNRGVYVAAVTTLDKVVSAAQSDEDSSPGGFLVQFAGSHLRVSGSLNSAADWSSLSQLLFATVWEYCTIASTVVADPNQR